MLEVEKPPGESAGEVPEMPETRVEVELEEPVRSEVIETLEKPVQGSWTAIFPKLAEIFRHFYESIAKKN